MIYDSPDFLGTFHVGEHGSSSRSLPKTHEWLEKANRLAKRKERLLKICILAETNPTLNDQLLKLEELYMLIRDDKDD
jgi:ATP:corrinoid adenosyltransferase